ncbi:MAG: 4-hydroxy-tetrahydrodipicolinate reductase [Deltaproteobacteria bacterium RIFCSPLOWO2_02_FULL_57_26]|nr:MAG: 4-hydroxy-tetrahydrodipicolinate reductase [Deltaproteobacteria bacterium RIFCSPLOWO2_02_FULL_57_26]OGQ84640.1 MAG: 4-hydroxy-tetrahydrodipicolinate reductase [Deltaproteobacteria bacterium RIFCSPLOWO2_12_FULL_57_22]
MLGLVVCGAAGRMGGTVVRLIQESTGVRLVGAVEWSGSPQINKDAGEVAGVGKIGVPIAAQIEPLLKGQVVVIEFTTPEATLEHLKIAARNGSPIVIGTTGFNPKQLAEIKRLSRRTRVLMSPNMSVGVNLLVSLLGKVAETLGEDYDVEIVEAHHRFKKDAPSGTALALGRAVAQALKRDLDKVGVCGRKGIVGERTRKEIGVMAVRAGDIVGEHTVIFGGLGERVEFIHRAHSRDTFARGAIRAAQWLVKQKKGLYSMQDVLGLD